MDGGRRTYYQAGLDLRGRTCLVVGGGAVARRKAEGLAEAGADVRVVAPRCLPMPGAVRVALRPFEDDDLDGVTLAVAASDDRELNARVAALARRRGVWVNVVDEPEEGDLVLPAVVRRGALRVAVSTGGASPALALRIRERLDEEFGPEWGELAELLGRLRTEWEPRAIAAGVPPAARRAAWHEALDLPLAKLLAAGRAEETEAQVRVVLERVLAEAGGQD
jgi:precorrin-2 dehydrogenase / sirohydrochlorin ferrochelatase